MSRHQAYIPLGFEVGSGAEVSIPAAHMAVVGVTQQSGKTTTLEALAHRSGRSVLAFVTKRGEGSFGAAPGHDVHNAQPYFRERADWQFVEAILEATLRERMKFERGWIMKVSRSAKTLQDVRRNVQQEIDKTRSQFARDMYEKLGAYLDIVVPQLSRIRWASALPLRPGLNVMNLGEMSSELQALVIASCLDFVMERHKDTIVIIPEAWEFLPRGRKSPVTLAGENFARKGAALKNFLWIDSQDITGVHTPILKQVTVWLLGVQREINEVKRTLAMVPAVPKRLKPEEITMLGLGQFYAVYAGHTAKAYVWPWWMSEEEARTVARGESEAMPHVSTMAWIADTVRHMNTRPDQYVITDIEDPMDTKLREENEALRRENLGLKTDIANLQRRVEQLLDQQAMPDESTDLARESVRPGPSEMTALPDDWLQQVRIKLLSDPAVIAHIAATRPKLIVEVTPRVVKIDGTTSRGRIARLIATGFFDSAKRQGECRTELQRTGTDVNGGQVSTLFAEFVRDGFLTRHGNDRYIKAPDLVATVKELQAV